MWRRFAYCPIYPKYYPVEVVDFFCEHHCIDAIAKDIEKIKKFG